MAFTGDDLAELFNEKKQAGAFDDDLNAFMVGEVVPTWKANYPVDTGAGRDSIQVTEPARGGKGKVGALDDAASFVEYGTEDTPERAPLRRTIEQLQNR